MSIDERSLLLAIMVGRKSTMLYLEYFMDGLFNFSLTTNIVVIGFSLVSVYFMKERIGTFAAVLYFPFMVLCAFVSNYIFWSEEVFRGDQDLERIFAATIVGMMFSLLIIIIVNNFREYYWSLPSKRYSVAEEGDWEI